MIQDRFLIFTAALILSHAAVSFCSVTPAPLQNGAFKARLNNVEISYTVSGSGPVILVQGVGWGLDSRLYQNTLKFLETNFTLVYIDPRGTGDVAPLTDLAQLSSDHMVDDLEALRQHLGLSRLVLLGHAHGGFIAMKYALKYPARMAQLIIVDCILFNNLEDDIRLVNENLQRHPRRKEPHWETAIARFKDEYAARTTEALRENLQTTAVLYFNYYGQSQRAVFERSLHEGKLSIHNFDQFLRSDLVRYNLDGLETRLNVPTLLLYGMYDPYFIRASARQLHFSIRNSKLEIFERSGHFPWMEESAHFAEVFKAFVAPGGPPVITETSREKPQNQ